MYINYLLNFLYGSFQLYLLKQIIFQTLVKFVIESKKVHVIAPLQSVFYFDPDLF